MSRKLKKKTRRILILTGSLIALLLLILSSLQIYLNLNVLRGNDVLIDLRSNHDFFQIENEEPLGLQFTSRVQANPFCSPSCSYTFTDASTNAILHEGSFSVYTSSPQEQTFEVTTEKGEGTKLYQYDISCSTEQTFFCRTKENPTSRRMKIAVKHTLNPNQLEIQEQSTSLLEDILTELDNALDVEATITTTRDNLPYSIELPEMQTKQILQAISVLKELEQLYVEQDVESFYRELEQLKPSISFITASLSNVQSTLETTLEEYNKNLADIKTLRQELTAVDTLILQNPSTNNEIQQLAIDFNITLESFSENSSIPRIITSMEDLLAKGNAVLERAENEHARNKQNLTQRMNAVHASLCSEINCSTYTIKNSFNTTLDLCSYIKQLNETLETTSLHIPQCTHVNTSVVNVTLPNLRMQYADDELNITYAEPQEICCISEQCIPCCRTAECKHIPTIFIHGHAIDKDTSPDSNIDSFTNLQRALEDEGIINMGRISLYQYAIPKGTWGLFDQPISLKVSYYYDVYEQHDDSIIIQTKNENIDTYAVRIKDTVDRVLYWTGAEKVNIIAHSMGGLVTRRYMQIFGTDKVNQVLTAGSPHNGTFGLVADLCPVFGEDLECRDMKSGSLFLRKLNSQPLPDIPFTNIVAIGCDMNGQEGDGIVLEKSATLPGANTIVIEGECKGTETLHTNFIRTFSKDDTFYQTVLNVIKE
jgi:uncharacterized alpha/beta hydrolase family protein